MKVGKCLALIFTMALLLCGCGEKGNSLPADGTIPATPQALETPEAGDPSISGTQTMLFEADYAPVASSQGHFIVRNESGNLYGLLDSAGNVVLPCEYETLSFSQTKSQMVLKATQRGSRGVFDLNGQELIPCSYTEITLSPLYDLSIVKNFMGKQGVLDLGGNIVLPMDFDVVHFGYGTAIAAAKNAHEQLPASVSVYRPDGALIKEYPWDKGEILDVVFGNGEKLISVNYSTRPSHIELAYLPVEGDVTVWGDTRCIEDDLFYFQANDLIMRDGNTSAETILWSFPQELDAYSINSFQVHEDPVTHIKYVDLFVVGGTDREETNYLRVSLENTPSVIDYRAAGIQKAILGGDDLGAFYNGVAIVFPKNGYLYTVDTKGNRIGELTNPYTDRENSFLLKYSAVLNNNGFYSIVDQSGNELLSPRGYSNVQEVNVSGLYLVTDQEGQMGLINDHAEELIPCGEIVDIQTAIERPDNDAWDLEAKNEAEDDFYVLYDQDMWALYRASSGKLITDFEPCIEDTPSARDLLLGRDGYALINEEADTLYLIAQKEGAYQVSEYLSLT